MKHIYIFTPLLLIILLSFSVNSFSQNDTSSLLKEGKLVIAALPYTNDINKYYFDETAMDKLAVFMQEHASVYVEINCFSDFKDSPLLNLMATTEQANDIRNYLVQKGVAGSRMKTIGNGDLFPLVSEDKLYQMTDDEREKASIDNRRIEIVVIKKGS